MQIVRVILLLVNLVASLVFLYAALRAHNHIPVAFLLAAGFILNFAFILTAPRGKFE